MRIHKSEIYTFNDLDAVAQSKVYHYFDLVRFSELQKQLQDYKLLSLNNRVNYKGMFKSIVKRTNDFHVVVKNDCLCNRYLKDGYILNQTKLETVA